MAKEDNTQEPKAVKNPSIDLTICRIKDLLKAFQQNNMQTDYLELLDDLSELSCEWYDELHEELRP